MGDFEDEMTLGSPKIGDFPCKFPVSLAETGSLKTASTANIATRLLRRREQGSNQPRSVRSPRGKIDAGVLGSLHAARSYEKRAVQSSWGVGKHEPGFDPASAQRELADQRQRITVYLRRRNAQPLGDGFGATPLGDTLSARRSAR
jgi:hypothetical protein